MKCRNRVLLLPLVVILALALVVPASLAQQRRLVTIASGWVVGVYYPLAGAMSRIVYKVKDLNLRATVESSGASVANAQLIGTGDADFALLQNDIAFYAYNGVTLSAFKDKPIKNMGAIFTIYPELVHVVATKASGIKTVKELRGRRVVLGPQGSGTEANALQILEAYGLKESDLKAERIDAAAAADQIKDGRVDAGFFTTGMGSAVILDTFISGKVALVTVDGAEAEAMKKKYPFYTSVKVPANTYKDQAEATTVAVMAMMVARSDLPEDLVYKFTKAIFDDLKQFHEAHSAAKSLTLETALAGNPIPLHPGAARFYKEKGILR
ncbi:MAG: TRAP transporter solute receptor, TAXI family [Candidatus Rokubacteria bacterium CSP1-6]|nr:MAG: TRAP transporter solute receptor, TAXI family [Candidatus Rokubacteria bacterium CSP1-6]